ncbi:MAG: glutamate--tRNA ligase [Deltaproteobacteria bacterium]|nr:glutamate--tRNA ligase [Deltaproteobacteria bacterium]
MTDRVRTRFAPSPTGYLHLGNARTALFNLLFSRASGGDFLLRIDDTDLARSSIEFEKALMEDLTWLGLNWDETPLRQSERIGLYQEHAERLLKNKAAYRCYCTKERLESLKKNQLAAGKPPRYDNACRGLQNNASEAPHVVRFRVSQKEVSFIDGVHGRMAFQADDIGDFVIIGSDSVASYNFASTVDDGLMAITHVIRGDDHLSNTPRQLLLSKALGFDAPVFCHIPLVLGPDRMPLSKRDAGASVRSFREHGFLPLAVINTLSRLGWSLPDGTTLKTLEELTQAFSLKRLARSSAIFDVSTLRLYNKAAIQTEPIERLMETIGTGHEAAYLKKVVVAARPNASTLKELSLLVRPFIAPPELTPEARAVLSSSAAVQVIKACIEALRLPGAPEAIDEQYYKLLLSGVTEKTGVKGKSLYMPVRAALTGSCEGLELAVVFALLGRKGALERLERS